KFAFNNYNIKDLTKILNSFTYLDENKIYTFSPKLFSGVEYILENKYKLIKFDKRQFKHGYHITERIEFTDYNPQSFYDTFVDKMLFDGIQLLTPINQKFVD